MKLIKAEKVGKYVIISPIRNERVYIEHTIRSVCSQSVKPEKWVLVSDCSDDGTDELVKNYANKYGFMEFYRMPKREHNDFRSKVMAFNFGFNYLKCENYQYIGNLDGDVSFSPDYFSSIISLFNEEPLLGITGGHIYDVFGKRAVPHRISANSVAGAVQIFRRECYEDINGYLPLAKGIDTAAEISARAKGWKVRTCFNLTVKHHKPMKTGASNYFKARMSSGKTNYQMGYHPLFQICSCLLRLNDKPLILGAFAVWWGYFTAYMKRVDRILPQEIIDFLRKEQMMRLRGYCKR